MQVALRKHLKKPQTPQDDIYTALQLVIDPLNLVDMLRDIDCAFEKARFNAESKIGLVRTKLKEIPDVFHYFHVRSVHEYKELC